MKLPGGLLRDGQLRRDFSFKPVTGELERAIAESGLYVTTLAEQVTLILGVAVDEVAGIPVDTTLVRSLSSGDRQYLLHQLEALLAPTPQWITQPCAECGENIQFQIVPGTLPVKAADDDFPQASLALSIGEVMLRVPNGADEEAIARHTGNGQYAMGVLLQRLLSCTNRQVDSASLTADDLQRIDCKLDQMSPQLGVTAHVTCPYCAYQQHMAIDHYEWITRETAGLDEEIHLLALHYHWSEGEILALPGMRRKRYLQLIEQSLGKYRAADFQQGSSRRL